MIVAPGEVIGRFEVQGIAGRGTSSIVYRATDANGNEVAIKALRGELLVEAETRLALQRFERELRIGRAVRHPRIVRLLEWGRHRDLPFIVMEYVAGETLDQRLQRAGPLPPRRVREIVCGVLDALAYVHGQGVIHRDVKPANIVLRGAPAEGDSADPVLMDFGVAHLASLPEVGTSGAALTQQGEILGTPAFLAPEQLADTPIDHRADLFAVGVMLQLLLTGRRPFDGTLASIMHAICFGEPAPLPPHLAEFAPLIARALAKDPGARFADAESFGQALRSLHLPGETEAEDDTARRPPPTPATPDELEKLLARAAAEGVDAKLLATIDDTLARITVQHQSRVAELCGGETLQRLFDLLLRTAPLPGVRAERLGHWVDGLDLLTRLLPLALSGPDAASVRAAAADFPYRLAAGVMAYGSDVAEGLAQQDMPDIGMHAMMLLRIDSIAFGLGNLGAGRERRLVEAMGRVIAGQVLRCAANAMLHYVYTRDPLARFEVATLLVGVEDLIALAGRLAGDAAAGARPDAVASRSLAALGRFLEALAGLIELAAADLDAALAADTTQSDDTAIGAFIANLKQVALIHRFCLGLEADAFQEQLASASQSIYVMCERVAENLLTKPPQARIAALYDVSEALGWRALSARLLAHIRGRVKPAS